MVLRVRNKLLIMNFPSRQKRDMAYVSFMRQQGFQANKIDT